MLTWPVTTIHDKILVQMQAKLNKVVTMTLVIRYVEIIFHDRVSALIMWIKVSVFHPCGQEW